MPRARPAAGSLIAAAVALATCCAPPAFSFAAASPAPRADTPPLTQGQAIARDLQPKETHLHHVTLAPNELATLIVDQRHIDTVVETRRADGSAIAEFQEAPGRQGEERIELAADAAGTYIVAVTGNGSVLPDTTGSYSIRLVNRRPATDADRSMQQARALRAEGVRLDSSGKSAEARTRFERALALSEAARGPDDAFTGLMLFELADNAIELREDDRAEALYVRALAVLDRVHGAEHPFPAMARSRMSVVYWHKGQIPKAEALLRQAADTLERTLGTEHLWFAQALLTQGNLRMDAGDVDKAEELELRAMAILERIDATENAQYASLLNNLSNVYRQRRDHDRAEALMLRALALNQRLDGEDSYHASIGYQNLGVLARERKDYAKAVDYYTRGLAIRERLMGSDHPDVAPLLNNLATVRHAMGDAAGSIDLHFRALRIQEQALGPYHRATLVSVGNIARRYAAIGDVAHAVQFQRRADTIIEAQLRLNLAVGSERQKLAFVNSITERTERTISLSVNEGAADPDAGALAALVLLQRKGRVLDAMRDAYAPVRERITDESHRALLERLSAATAQLARLALNAPEDRRGDDAQARIKALETQVEQLEADLSARSAELRAQLQPVTLDAVRAALPERAALLEFAVFRPFDPKAERNADAYAAPHYAALVIRPHAAPHAVDLGHAALMDEAIDALRASLRDRTRTDLRARARALHDRVLQPLRAAIGTDTQRLLISPDGDLNLVPFEAMIDARGRYLIEAYAIGYLTSGRDLLRMQVARTNHTAPVIVADPFFGAAAESDTAVAFEPLSTTGVEGRAIGTLFPEATLLTGRAATKAALVRLDAPRLLHIASHGFFLPDATTARASAPPVSAPALSASPVSGPAVSATPLSGTPAAATPATATPVTATSAASTSVSATSASSTAGTRAMRANVAAANPLLRSGLALAGANLTSGANAGDDGILTALEASGLNLWGTRLVTLSACDTGVGEVRNGEGVYGFRRAFVLAGAETLVMSLWPVSDYATRKMMTAYYTGLRAGLGRGDALRQAKLAMLGGKGRQPFAHPYYWASFIQSGEWAPLDGPLDSRR